VKKEALSLILSRSGFSLIPHQSNFIFSLTGPTQFARLCCPILVRLISKNFGRASALLFTVAWHRSSWNNRKGWVFMQKKNKKKPGHFCFAFGCTGCIKDYDLFKFPSHLQYKNLWHSFLRIRFQQNMSFINMQCYKMVLKYQIFQ